MCKCRWQINFDLSYKYIYDIPKEGRIKTDCDVLCLSSLHDQMVQILMDIILNRPYSYSSETPRITIIATLPCLAMIFSLPAG